MSSAETVPTPKSALHERQQKKIKFKATNEIYLKRKREIKDPIKVFREEQMKQREEEESSSIRREKGTHKENDTELPKADTSEIKPVLSRELSAEGKSSAETVPSPKSAQQAYTLDNSQVSKLRALVMKHINKKKAQKDFLRKGIKKIEKEEESYTRETNALKKKPKKKYYIKKKDRILKQGDKEELASEPKLDKAFVEYENKWFRNVAYLIQSLQKLNNHGGADCNLSDMAIGGQTDQGSNPGIWLSCRVCFTSAVISMLDSDVEFPQTAIISPSQSTMIYAKEPLNSHITASKEGCASVLCNEPHPQITTPPNNRMKNTFLGPIPNESSVFMPQSKVVPKVEKDSSFMSHCTSSLSPGASSSMSHVASLSMSPGASSSMSQGASSSMSHGASSSMCNVPSSPSTNPTYNHGIASMSTFYDEFNPSLKQTPFSPVIDNQPYVIPPIKRPQSMLKLYNISDDPARHQFLDKLILYQVEESGFPPQCPPIMSGQPVDLYRLYLAVKERGGYVEVMKYKHSTWRWIVRALGFTGSSTTAYKIRKLYIKHLLPFECKFDMEGVEYTPSQPVPPSILALDSNYRNMNVAGNEGISKTKLNPKKPVDSESISTDENAGDKMELDTSSTLPTPPQFPDKELVLVGKRTVDVNYFVSCLRQMNKHHATMACGLSDMIICEEMVKAGQHGIVFRCKMCLMSNFVGLEDPFNGRPSTITTQQNKNASDVKILNTSTYPANIHLSSNSAIQHSKSSIQKPKSVFQDFVLTQNPTLPKKPAPRTPGGNLPVQSQPPIVVQSHVPLNGSPQIAPMQQTLLAGDSTSPSFTNSPLIEMKFCVEDLSTIEDSLKWTPVSSNKQSTKYPLPPRTIPNKAMSKSVKRPIAPQSGMNSDPGSDNSNPGFFPGATVLQTQSDGSVPKRIILSQEDMQKILALSDSLPGQGTTSTSVPQGMLPDPHLQSAQQGADTAAVSRSILLPPKILVSSSKASSVQPVYLSITPDIASTDVLPVDLNLVKMERNETSVQPCGTLPTIVPETIRSNISVPDTMPVDLNLVKKEKNETECVPSSPATIVPYTISSDVAGALPVNLNLVKKEIE